MKQRVSLGNSSQAIVITNLEFDEHGFATGQKAGILPIDSADHDPIEMLEHAAKFEWQLTGKANLQGFYGVKRGRELTPEEIATQTIANRSIMTKLTTTDEATSKDVIQRETNTPSRVGEPLVLER
jgi:hypothetical protein